ncbi:MULTISPECIES: HAD family hydrolase [unclassified Carboxylicivirga]|uniref:HAD family hydrolase n=1 Tax=Carboxylicivirga TaxID=1628153 RepID=UPI003D32A289
MAETHNQRQKDIIISRDIKGLIFDMDGTLLNSTPVHYQAWLSACQPFGVSFDYDFFITLTGRPVIELARDLIARYELAVTPMDLVAHKESLVEDNLNKVTLIPAVFDVLERYRGLLPMAVGTGASRQRAERLLRSSGIEDRFKAIVTSDDVSHYKPHPETFLNAAAALGVAPADCLVFEDGHLGIEAAKAAGMQVIDVKPYYD